LFLFLLEKKHLKVLNMEFKKISIITPAFNRKDMLETAIKNVLMQNYPNLEHIVVDGGSNDGTQDMIKKYPHVRFISESDRGMYDALNKGLSMSNGEIVGFLNTDDLYADNILLDIASNFTDENFMAIAGCAIVFSKTSDGKTVTIGRYSPKDKTLLECSTIGSNYFNAWFFRRSVFEKIGAFNINYRIAGDRDLMLRFALNNLHYIELDKVVYQYLQHSESLTFHDSDEKREQIVEEHLSMTSFYLQNTTLSKLERRLIIQLRTNESVNMATRAIRKWRLRKFFYYFYEGTKKDLFWTYKFIKSILVFRFKKAVGFAKNVFKRGRWLIFSNGRS
jgi:glycosyltransferase involved in cell wall biosynthesis